MGMNTRELLGQIGQDESQKALFIASLSRSKPKLGDTSLEKYWYDTMEHVYQTINRVQGHYSIDKRSLITAIQQSAEFGLSFNQKFKECYLEMRPSVFKQDTVTFELALKYNGMKSRLVKTCGVTNITTQVVNDNDTFEWRGQWKEPFFVMANEGGNPICCYAMVELNNQKVMACRLSWAEMQALEEADLQRVREIHGDDTSSFYKGPYRLRMFEIGVLRHLYRELISYLEEPDAVGEEHTTHSIDEADLAKAIEAELDAQMTQDMNYQEAS